MIPTLELKNICKSFPGVVALNNVSLDIYPGEVHILAGENGAGKSTLMKILAGVYKPEKGEIIISGEKKSFDNPGAAESCGIRMIYQEFNLISELSVMNNIYLGHEKSKKGFPVMLDSAIMEAEARALLDRLNVKIDPKKKIKDLGVGQQQMIEIAKALSVDAKVIVFDEPTSSLTNKEIEELFRLIRFLKEKDVSIFYISHRLEENFEIGDRVTILRDGNVIDTKPVSEISMNEMIEKIANRNINNLYPRYIGSPGDVVLEVKDLTGKKFSNVNLNVKSGEIVGLSGLVGAGRTELACAVFGVDDYESGEVLLCGKKIAKNNPQLNVELGMSLLPEDRKNFGLSLDLSIKENVLIASMKKYFPNLYIAGKKEKSLVQKYVDSLKIATSSIEKKARQLSGGTQQKVVVSKWLSTGAKLFIFDEPTRGIDVGAKTEIYKLMDELAANGAAILMISSDLPEILGMSERVYVMASGNIVGEFKSSETSQAEILKYAFKQTGKDRNVEQEN